MEFYCKIWILKLVIVLSLMLCVHSDGVSDTHFTELTRCVAEDHHVADLDPLKCADGKLLYINTHKLGSKPKDRHCHDAFKEFDCNCNLDVEECTLNKTCQLSKMIRIEKSKCRCKGALHIYIKYKCLSARATELMTTFEDTTVKRNIQSIMVLSHDKFEMTSLPTKQCKIILPKGTLIKIEVLQHYTTKQCESMLEIYRNTPSNINDPDTKTDRWCSGEDSKYRERDWLTSSKEYAYIRVANLTSDPFETKIWVLITAERHSMTIQCGIDNTVVREHPELPGTHPKGKPDFRRPGIPQPQPTPQRDATTTAEPKHPIGGHTTDITGVAATGKSEVENKYNVVVGSIIGGAVLLACLALYALTLLFINTLRKRKDSAKAVTPPPDKLSLGYSASTLDRGAGALPYATFSEEGKLQFYDNDPHPEPQPRYQKNTTNKKGSRRKFSHSSSQSLSTTNRVDHIVLPSKNPRHQYQGGLHGSRSTPSISGSLPGSYHSQNSSPHNSLHSQFSHPSSHSMPSSHRTDITELTTSSSSGPDTKGITWGETMLHDDVFDDVYESLEHFDRRPPPAPPVMRPAAPYHNTMTPKFPEEENYTPTLGGLAGMRGRMFVDMNVHQGQY